MSLNEIRFFGIGRMIIAPALICQLSEYATCYFLFFRKTDTQNRKEQFTQKICNDNRIKHFYLSK